VRTRDTGPCAREADDDHGLWCVPGIPLHVDARQQRVAPRCFTLKVRGVLWGLGVCDGAVDGME
jgi:hypothetical protein